MRMNQVTATLMTVEQIDGIVRSVFNPSFEIRTVEPFVSDHDIAIEVTDSDATDISVSEEIERWITDAEMPSLFIVLAALIRLGVLAPGYFIFKN